MSLKTEHIAAPVEGFGTFFGVYVPSLLAISGVVLYLHFGPMLSSGGLAETLLIISLSFLITSITSLSIASIATNSEVGKGGAYFLISRVFGIEIGSAIALPLFFAQAIGIAFYILCFAESIQSVLPHFSVREIGLITLFALTTLTYLSSQLAIRGQLAILGLIGVALLSLFSGGAPISPGSLETLITTAPVPFWKMFALFFPAVTGIEVGLSLSGSLRSPRKALPLGTIAAVATGYLIYLSIPLFLWLIVPTKEQLADSSLLMHVARFGNLVLLGLWGGALSSSLGSILAAPRLLQALAKDRVLPPFFGKESNRRKDPHIATLLAALLPCAVIWFGNISMITPVLTMFFLMSYGMLNLSAAIEGILGNPSWRPTFEVPWPISLAGALICFMAMFMIDAGSTFAAALLTFIVYAIVRRRNKHHRWDDIRQGILLFFARFAVYRLSEAPPSIRSWRPHFLVFTATPSTLSPLLDFTSSITRNKSLLTMASILCSKIASAEKAHQMEKRCQEFLKKNKIQALVEVHIAPDIISGIKKLITSYGTGPLRPNTIVLGENGEYQQILPYAEVIQLSHSQERTLVIVRSSTLSPPLQRKTIDILWDDEVRENSELMVLLAHMLHKSTLWRRAKICLKGDACNETAQKQRQEHFASFCQTSRLAVEAEVLIERSTATQAADLTFVSLRPPAIEEPLTEYAAYYENVLRTTTHLPLVAYVMSGSKLDLGEVFR